MPRVIRDGENVQVQNKTTVHNTASSASYIVTVTIPPPAPAMDV